MTLHHFVNGWGIEPQNIASCRHVRAAFFRTQYSTPAPVLWLRYRGLRYVSAFSYWIVFSRLILCTYSVLYVCIRPSILSSSACTCPCRIDHFAHDTLPIKAPFYAFPFLRFLLFVALPYTRVMSLHALRICRLLRLTI
jgi:hypothetical protein